MEKAHGTARGNPLSLLRPTPEPGIEFPQMCNWPKQVKWPSQDKLGNKNGYKKG